MATCAARCVIAKERKDPTCTNTFGKLMSGRNVSRASSGKKMFPEIEISFLCLEPTRPRTAMAVIKPEFALKSEHSSCVPVKVEGLEIPPAADVSKCDSNSEKTKTFSDITENHGFGKTAEYEVPPTETVHRRSLRERRRAAAPVVDLLDDDDDDDDGRSD